MNLALSEPPVTLKPQLDRPTCIAASDLLLYLLVDKQVLAFSRTSGDLLHRSPQLDIVADDSVSISVTCGHLWVLIGVHLIALSLDLSAVVARSGDGLVWDHSDLPSADLLLVQGCSDSVMFMSLHFELPTDEMTEVLARTPIKEDKVPSSSSATAISSDNCSSDTAEAKSVASHKVSLKCKADDESTAFAQKAKLRARNQAVLHRYQFDVQSKRLELQASNLLSSDSASSLKRSLYFLGSHPGLRIDPSQPLEYSVMQHLQGAVSQADISHVCLRQSVLSVVTASGEVWALAEHDNSGIPWPTDSTDHSTLTRLNIQNVAEFYPMRDSCLWLDRNGALFAYGTDHSGYLGLGLTPDKQPHEPGYHISASVPTRVLLPKLVQLCTPANGMSCIARADDGRVFVWGQEFNKQFDAPGLIGNTRPQPQALPHFNTCAATWVTIDSNRNVAICDVEGRLWLYLSDCQMLGDSNRRAVKLMHFKTGIEHEFVIKAEISSFVCLVLCRSGKVYSFGWDVSVREFVFVSDSR